MVRMTSFRFSRAANSILNTFVGLRKKFLKNFIFARGKWSPHPLVFRVVLPLKNRNFSKIPKPFKYDLKRINGSHDDNWLNILGFWDTNTRILEQDLEIAKYDKVLKQSKMLIL